MKFQITSSGHFYKEISSDLIKLGFKFHENKTKLIGYEAYSKSKEGDEKDFSTLEELMNFVKEFGQIVLNEDSIEIYDDYRE